MRSPLPDPTVGLAKVAVEVDPLTAPGVTVTVGCVVNVTPPTTTVRVRAVPAVVPVKVAEYVPGVAVAVTDPNVPPLVPPDTDSENALAPRPATAALDVSLTTIVTTSPLPDATVGLAKLIVEFDPLIGSGVTVTVG